MDNLKQVVHRLGVGPHRPSDICAATSSLSQLVYCDEETGKIHWVDCSTAPPAQQGEIPIVHNGQEELSDMCISGDLLVVARLIDGVFAYTLDGGELKWRVSGRLSGMQDEICAVGVRADKQGLLFVCDFINECVHMLSVRDGTHLEVVGRKGEGGEG